MDHSILIIDDESKIRTLLSRIIELEGFKVLQAATARAGLKLLETNEVLVVLCDVRLPDADGLELVAKLKSVRAGVEVINLTAFGTIADGVKAMNNGAFDYLVKGDDNERIIPLLHRALEKAALHSRVVELEKRIGLQQGFARVIGASVAIKEAIGLAQKVAATDTTVLLLGETGTGKEVFAQAIHYSSPRSARPFVALNCSGFSAELLESELFGYKQGAFTGANKDKKGLLEEADQGTLFLDEIGEMNIDLQAKLLRVLENQSFIKLGGTQTSRVNVRIIAATNRDLKDASQKGSFRSDLFYRLSVFAINLPSLSQRKGDVVLLAKYYLKDFSQKVNRKGLTMDESFVDHLNNHQWKGNIRELKNIIERAVILAEGETIGADLLPYEFKNSSNDAANAMDMSSVEKQHLAKVLNFARGNKTEAARLLGIGLTTLYRKLEEYKIS